ncbi:hypothetical protein BDW60DRAFT_210960 [Aspergillus nidulans var. acristatus]
MAALRRNKWYLWYLREAANGNLELPDYKLNDNNCIILHYGEVFCRVPDCSKATKKFSATNNLHTHIKTHDGMKLEEGNTGGRVAQKVVDRAVQWYKSLFSGIEPQANTESLETSLDRAGSVEDDLPLLPKKKDGTVHVTNMRLEVVRLGKPVPCKSCGTRNACCKDISKCDHFILFNCGNLHPGPTVNQGDNNASEAAA